MCLTLEISDKWLHYSINMNILSVVASVSIQELGDLAPLISKLNCTGTESKLSECPLRNDTTSFGSGSGDVATLIPSIPGGQLQPSFDSCQNLARVGCRGWWATNGYHVLSLFHYCMPCTYWEDQLCSGDTTGILGTPGVMYKVCDCWSIGNYSPVLP